MKNSSLPNSTPHRTTLYARNLRARLVQALGGKCEKCGKQKDLEFDHIHGRDYDVRKLSYSARMKRYEREAELGLLRLLCGPCNREARCTNDNGAHIRTIDAALVPLTKALPF